MSIPQTPKQQINEICRIIQKDANARQKIITVDGKMCAIGGLAHYGAKVSKAQLQRMDRESNYGNQPSDQAWREVVTRFPVLQGTYASQVWRINDAHHKLVTRRKALITFFRALI